MAPWQGCLVWQKVFSDDFWQFEQFKYWEKRLFMYTSSQGLSNRSHIKVSSRCFHWCPAVMLVSLKRAPIWRLHTELYKFAWNVSPNNSRTVYCANLRLGEVVYLLIFCNIWNSWLLLLNGFESILDGVTVKTGSQLWRISYLVNEILTH